MAGAFPRGPPGPPAPRPAPAAVPAGLNPRLTYWAYRAGAGVAAALPEAAARPVARGLARAAVPLLGRRGAMVARHAARVAGRSLTPAEEKAAVRASVESYARYWMESLRLRRIDHARIDAQFSIEGLEHIEGAREAGTGAVLAIPHVGGWDVGGAWFVAHGFPLAVVVEPVEPPELFEWFAGLRRSFGLKVIALGTGAGTEVLRCLRANEVVGLLCDRDIGGGGVEVEFFGERTTLPGGPATLALRAGAPVLPTAIYFDGPRHRAVVRPPIDFARTGRFRDDVARLTQAIATELEALIRPAPDQWHLFQPNWPSDREGG
ncbi:MAG: phosphatidylinositol mannoside acyltransferase [Actinomycetota bacterium]